MRLTGLDVVLLVWPAPAEPVVLAVIAAVLAKTGLLKVELKQPVQRQPRSTSEPPAVTGGQS
jgi:hypothetical protein